MFWNSLLSSFQLGEISDVTGVGETLAYTWFGRTNAVYSEETNKYWIGSTKDTENGTTQHITEFDINEESYVTTQIGTQFAKDDHNQAQIIIRNSDKRLIAFYAEHNSIVFRMRISSNPFDGKSWQNEIVLDPSPSGGYSYVSPYQDSTGNLYVFYRVSVGGGQYVWRYIKSTNGGVSFGSEAEFFNDGNVQAYLITCQDGNKVHFTASNGHPENNPSLNVGVYHFYFDMENETFHNSIGSNLSLPLVTNVMSLVKSTSGNNTSWILDITTKFGQPRIIFAYYPEGRVNEWLDKELWYSSFNGSSWSTADKISKTRSGYMEDDASIEEKAYTGASRFDSKNPDIIWMPKDVDGVLEIHKVDISTNPIYIEQITFDSEVDNWRPISVPSPVNNLVWIKKNRYDFYTDYELSLQTKTVQV